MTTSTNPWITRDISGITCQVFLPAEPHEHRYTILYLPDDTGGNKLAVSEATVADLRERRLQVVMPQLEATWGIDQPIPGQDSEDSLRQTIMERLIPGITDEMGAAPPRIALFGEGMGGQAALRLSFEDPRDVPGGLRGSTQNRLSLARSTRP